MRLKNIKKLLFLVAVTILLVGLVSAATVNKTSNNKDTKTIKETQKSLSDTDKVKTTATKTIDKKTNINKENKVKAKRSESKTYTTTASSFKDLYNKIKDAEDSKYENYTCYTINLKKGKYTSTKELKWENNENIQLLTINGNGATINGKNKHRFITVYKNCTLTLNNIKLTNFKSDYGGVIKNQGNLIIQNCQLNKNKATNDGGAIYNEKAKMTITSSQLNNNQANYGGSIENYNGKLSIENSILNNNMATNDGGAIENYNGDSTFIKCTLNNNTAKGNGGVIDNYNGKITLNKSTLNYNTATGNGGAIYIDTSKNNKNTIKYCTFKKNKPKGKNGTIYKNSKSVKLVLSNNKINYEKFKTKLKIKFNKEKAYEGSKIKTSITLKDENNKVLKKQKLTLKIGKKTYNLKTNNNGKITINYKTSKPGTLKVLATYKGNDDYAKSIQSKKLNVKRVKEKLTMITPSTFKTDVKTKLTFKVRKGKQKVKTGTLIVKLNNKIIKKQKIKNGNIKLYIKMPNKGDLYTLTAEYHKNGKKITKAIEYIFVENSEKITFDTKTSALTNTQQLFTVKVTNPNGKVNHGTVRITLNNKIIANSKVKNGIVKTTYKMPSEAGYYTAEAEYYKNGIFIANLYKNIQVKAPTPILTTTLYFDKKSKSLGSGDYAYSFVEYYDQQYRKGAYVQISASHDIIPYTYRLTKAVFYHKSYTSGHVIQNTVTPKKVYEYGELGTKLINGYKPFKVQIYYRKMTNTEHYNIMKESLYY